MRQSKLKPRQYVRRLAVIGTLALAAVLSGCTPSENQLISLGRQYRAGKIGQEEYEARRQILTLQAQEERAQVNARICEAMAQGLQGAQNAQNQPQNTGLSGNIQPANNGGAPQASSQNDMPPGIPGFNPMHLGDPEGAMRANQQYHSNNPNYDPRLYYKDQNGDVHPNP